MSENLLCEVCEELAKNTNKNEFGMIMCNHCYNETLLQEVYINNTIRFPAREQERNVKY